LIIDFSQQGLDTKRTTAPVRMYLMINSFLSIQNIDHGSI